MQSDTITISDEKIYWIQIFITVSFGIIAYYILEAIFPYGVPDIELMHVASLWIVSAIYFLLLLGIPLALMILKYKEELRTSIKRSLKSFGTQLCLFILILGLTFLINI